MVESNTGGRTDTPSENESLGHISISQASQMAVRTARASATSQRGFSRKRMLFDVLSEDEDKDGYTVVLSFCPEGNFEGTPGQERFKFSKTGRFQDREVLRQPKVSKRFRIKRKTIVVSLIVVIVLIGFGVLVIALAKGNRCPAIHCQRSGAISHTDSVTARTSDNDSQLIAANWQFNPHLRFEPGLARQ